MRTISSSMYWSSPNSPATYAEIVAGRIRPKSTYPMTHKPYHVGDRNLMHEYNELVKSKKRKEEKS